MTAFLFLIVAPILLLFAVWIMQAHERRRSRINLSYLDRQEEHDVDPKG
jgi:hypothetical protein